MNIEQNTNEMDKKFKIPLLAWLKDEGCISFEDNIIYAEKAFFISSVIRWCVKEKEKRNLSDTRVNKYLRLLKQYLKEDLDLYWEDGKIIIGTTKREIDDDDDKEGQSGS